ncbi:ABC transporter substrate-binding protein [Alkalilimnicola ehrlichii MLHE-1]|uniref:Nitrate transporter n=1 Tax=Alkalilimnicola ehrlichii (strain ATCC BAA-1101 / DSM 17681 / MLHE-1) TaxID=187272 RepID=Q0A7Y8_ALKEH|nr:ABC transporter substrate-binding protein [Alkalilimnicola ehrlichii]ABI57049.1 nitrate transporter [Alkalilimnicola ehrlichii MLHE-1]
MDKDHEKRLNRRSFLKTGGLLSGAALMGMVAPGVRTGAWAGGSDGLEVTRVALGFIPLTDCAPLVIAREKGFFQAHGLDVQVSKEASWANIRDKVSVGALDGGHMLAGMPIASTLGVGATRTPMVTGFSMDLNGNAITVSNALYDRMMEADPEAMQERPITARALKKVIDQDKAAGRAPLTFAMVFPVSTHNYELRYWMAAAGINPDEDVRLVVIPPPQMVANLRARNMDGYCVGEPWNMRAVDMGIGKVLVTNYEIWNNNPEKVLGLTEEWVEKHPNTHRALLQALIQTNKWMDEPENREEVVDIISRRAYVNAPPHVVGMSMKGTLQFQRDEKPRPFPDFNVFHRYAATYPWRSHAVWFLTQMVRWGQLREPEDLLKVAERVYRPDLYREAARAVGEPYPTIDYKSEGTRDKPWTLQEASHPIEMGPDRFLDGRTFDPRDVMAYLEGFDVHSRALSLPQLAELNG